MTTSEKNNMLSVYRNVITKMKNDRRSKYIKVDEILEERVYVDRAAVLVHHHPIGKHIFF